MVNQGFFSASRLNEEKNKANRFAGEKENTIARVDGPSTPIGSEYGLGSLNINRGATFPVNIRPKKGFTLDDVYGIKKSFVSPSGNEVGQIATSDLTNLRVGSPEVRLASVKSYIPDVTKPYAPDDVGDYIRDTETKFPSKTYTDSRGDIYTKKPYTETTPGFQVYGGTGAQLIRRKGDDPNFSQNYSEASDRENFIKERNAYVKDQGRPTPPDPNKLKTIEGPMDAFKSLFGFGRNYQSGQAEDYKRFLSENENYNYKMYRKDMRDKVFSESNYGEDVERGTIDKPGYYYKDFQKPGVYRSEDDVKSYIKDRGAFMTGMPSNFEGGVSGRGEKSDDLSSMYRSTAGEEKIRQEGANTQENRSILQRVGDFLGGAVNTAIGAGSAEARTLDAQKAQEALNIASSLRDGSSVGKPDSNRSGTDTSATVNIGGRGGSSRSNTGSKSASRGTAGSRSRGGVSRGSSKSNTGSKSTARGARGSANSRSKGGTGSGRTSTSRTASKASKGRTGRSRTRCDIRTKINISPLINSNLVKDNLAEVAYFVQEIKK